MTLTSARSLTTRTVTAALGAALALSAVVAVGSPASAEGFKVRSAGVSLHDGKLNGVSLHGGKLNGVSLHGGKLNGVSLHGVSLHGVSLHGGSLT